MVQSTAWRLEKHLLDASVNKEVLVECFRVLETAAERLLVLDLLGVSPEASQYVDDLDFCLSSASAVGIGNRGLSQEQHRMVRSSTSMEAKLQFVAMRYLTKMQICGTRLFRSL